MDVRRRTGVEAGDLMQRVARRLWTLVTVAVLLSAGYTAGYLLDRPAPGVARTVPVDQPVDLPHGKPLQEAAEDV